MNDCSNFPKIFFDLPTSKKSPEPASQILLQSIFSNSIGDPIQLKLTTTHLLLSSQYSTQTAFTPQGEIALNLDLSYEMITKTTSLSESPPFHQKPKLYGIKFRRKNNRIFEVFNQSEAEISLWKTTLLDHIPQFGFDSQFKKTVKIGKGSFSEVYHAVNITTKEQTAVKLFRKSIINQNPSRKKLLQTEIKILRKLDHPNVIQLLGVYESNENYYILMKLVKGGQLAYKIQSKQRFQSSEIKSFIKKLLEGLEYIHSKGIIHRDIKPQNIMFNQKNEPVIVDFGFAAELKDSNHVLFKCGTVGFMPPEILRLRSAPKQFNPVWDVFSAGVIFYMMLFGESPFIGKSSLSLIKEGVAWQPYEIESYKCQYTKGTIDLLVKMLDENPSSRISSEEALSHPYFQEVDNVSKKKQQQLFKSFYCEEDTKKMGSLGGICNKENRIGSESKLKYTQKILRNN